MFKNQTETSRIVNLLLLAVCIVLCSFYLVRAFVFYDFPAEYRDGAVLQVVQDLSKGINPYALDYLSTDEAPRVVLDSGFLNVFPALLLVRVFGLSPAPALYIMGFIYLAASMVLIGVITKKLTGDLTLSLYSAILLFFCLRRWGLLCVRPDTLAETLMLILILSIVENRVSYADTVLRAFFLVLIVYLKPHYALIGLMVFFFEMKNRKLLTFLLSGSILFAGSVLIVNAVFPTHLSVWGIRLYEMFTGVGGGSAGFIYALDKWKRLFVMFFPVFLLTLWGGLRHTILFFTDKAHFYAEVSENNLSYVWVNIIVNALALTYLGRHDGADLWYFYFMLIPSMILIAMYNLHGIMQTSGNWMLILVIFSLCCFAGLFTTALSLSPRPKYIRRWEESQGKAYALLDRYRSEDMILSSPLAYYGTMNGIYNFNHGDLCYLPVTRADSGILKLLFPYVNEFEDKYKDYALMVLEKLRNREYSLVTIDSIDTPFEIFGKEDEFRSLLEENYDLADEFEVFVEAQGMETYFYIPKKE
ncbi:MAG: hypothetical protein IJT16_03940 [Lachnospiraceae bacterium]|nr:hypothetical protein [Lachnospiraceae bacterium]